MATPDLKGMIVQSLVDLTNEANAKAEAIGAATTDRTKLVHEIRTEETPRDETVAAFQNWYEEANARIEAEVAKIDKHIAETYLKAVSEEEVDALKVAYKDLKDKAVTARKYFLAAIPGATEEDLKDVPDLKNLRGGNSGQGGGTGAKRPRVQSLAYSLDNGKTYTDVSKPGKNSKGEDVVTTNFTVLAGALKDAKVGKVEVKDLQAAAFAAAGTDDFSTLDGKVFEFVTTVGEQNVTVKVQPKVADAE